MNDRGRALNTNQHFSSDPFPNHQAPQNSPLAYKLFRAATYIVDATKDLLNTARLPEIPSNTEYNSTPNNCTPAAVAEFCHNQWQIHKDSKPRWVVFRDREGNPIDIRSYLKEGNIPPEYWAEHARRPNGDFLARVDRIPYEYLPRSFQEARQREAQISIKTIGWIAGAKSEADAKERIFTVLSHGHRAYRAQQLDNRIKSDQEFRDLPVSNQYSATTILHTIAKRLGVNDQNDFVRSAFDQIRKDLYNNVVELAQKSDQQGTIVDAYRRIIRQYGSHPYDFLRYHKDAYGALFNKIESKGDIEIGLPDLNQLKPEDDIPQNLKTFLGLDTRHTFKLKKPPTESSQGASILIVTDSTDHPVRVLRIDTGWRAVQEYLSERIIAENEKIGYFFTSPHQIIAIADPSNGVDGNKQKFLTVSNYAGGKSLDERFLANVKDDNGIPAEIGQRLAAFHSATVREQSPDAILDPSKTIKSIRYDLDGIRRKGLNLAERTQTDNSPGSIQDDNISKIAISYQRLEPLIISLAERFENTAFLNPSSFEKATAHGDMHPGNMFDTFIDNNTLVYSLGRQAPITSPAVDVGRCIGYLIVEGTRLNKSFEDIMADISKLREAYRDGRNNADKPILDKSIHSMAEDFYAMVYVAQNCVDVDQVKLKPLNSIESQTELILRLHANVNSYVTRDDAALREQSGNENRPDELLESTKNSPFFRRLWRETGSSSAKQ